MTSPKLKNFHVRLDTWATLGLNIEARSARDARERAEALYAREGELAFDVVTAGSDPLVAIPVSRPNTVGGGRR
jgi:hypothetical protein